MDHNWHNTYGSFDAINLVINSHFSKKLTDGYDNVTSESPEESIIAWMTLWHEWVHFTQFNSTTFGLLVTLNRVRQQSAFLRTCLQLAEFMTSKREKPILYTPFIKAIRERKYPLDLDEILSGFFMVEWQSAENNLKSNFGAWPEKDGSTSYATIPLKLIKRLMGSILYANERFTVGHIVEPIAIGCQTRWAFDRLGKQCATPLLEKILPTSPVYAALPLVERDLGINHVTRLILHDLALMLPVETLSSGKVPIPQTYSPSARLFAALELIAEGGVTQPNDWTSRGLAKIVSNIANRFRRYDSASRTYLKLATELARKLAWPEPVELARAALGLAEQLKANFSETYYAVMFDDFIRSFNVRIKEPDAFCYVTGSALDLYNSGWQPVFDQSEGYWHPVSQSQNQANHRLRASLSIRACRSLVLGDVPWKCPYTKRCGVNQDPNRPFLTALPECECGIAVRLATGSAFEPKDIVVLS